MALGVDVDYYVVARVKAEVVAQAPLPGKMTPMSTYVTILLVAAVLVLIAAVLIRAVTRKRHPAKKCSRCGKPSSHGYPESGWAESDRILPVCVDCLLRQLDEDYCTFDGRAVVIQPVAEFSCYIFRPNKDWSEAVRNDTESILARIEKVCYSCGLDARYAWVNALEPAPVAKVPRLGIRQTLLTQASARPAALCGRCTVQRIGHSLRQQEGGYLEICGPRGKEDGLVCGMG